LTRSHGEFPFSSCSSLEGFRLTWGRNGSAPLSTTPTLFAVALALALTPGCTDGPDREVGEQSVQDLVWTADEELAEGEFPSCAGDAPTWPPTVDLVVVRGEDAPCELDFVEVLRLGTSGGAWHPRPPIAVTPDGGYITGTWQRGTLALWSPAGEFVRTLGQGPGEGPGEFGWAGVIVMGTDSVINVTSGPRLHRYDLYGEFLETVRLPVTSGQRDAVATREGSLVTSASVVDASLRPGLVSWELGGSRVLESPVGSRGESFFLAYTPRLGLWIAEASRYELEVRREPGEESRYRIVRAVDWFPGEEGEIPANLYGIEPDPRGMVWTLASTPAPDAPSGELPPARSVDEIRDQVDRYRDNVIEALAVDGRLVASKRYPLPSLAPTPVTSARWYLQLRDLEETIVILEPVLRPH
jgi:hypothetical protein